MKPILRNCLFVAVALVCGIALAEFADQEPESWKNADCSALEGDDSKMFKVVALVKRRPGMSVEEFRDYYENRHAPLALVHMVGVCRYFRRFINRQVDAVTGEVSEPLYDSISEFWFPSREEYEATMRNMARPEVEAEMGPDETHLFDRSNMIIFEVEEFESVIPGAGALEP